MTIIKINQFDGGMATDIRSPNANECSICRHFNIFSFPHRLVPFGGLQTDNTGQTSGGNYLIGSDGVPYLLGTDVNNPTLQDIYKKTTASDPTSAWTEVANTKSGKVVNYKCFVEYKNYFYTLDANRYVMRFDRTGVASVNTTFSDLTSFTDTANGIVHPKDDILYIPYDNKIWSLNGHNGTPTVVALTLPTNRRISSLAAYGNYLAIATVPVTAGAIDQNAIVYLWNRDPSSFTLAESVDWGNGTLNAINVLDGILVGVSISGGSSTYARSTNTLQIKTYVLGQTPELVKEISAIAVSMSPIVNFVNSNRLYFAARLSYTTGVASATNNFTGVWAFGRNKEGRWALSIERVATTDNSDYANYPLAAVVVKDYALINYTSAGTLSVTKSSSTDFSNTSIYESLINPGMSEIDRAKPKKLLAVGVTFAKLTGTAQVVLKYRVDSAITDAWTTVFTKTATSPDSNLQRYESPVDSSSAYFTDGVEYEFRIESTNGAEITGLVYKYQTLTSLV